MLKNMVKKMINIKSNPNKKPKKVEYKVEIENDKQLKQRIAKLEGKLTIKDDTNNKCLFYETVFEGKRYKTMARYNKKPKEQALKQINEKKQALIEKLTIHFN